MTTLARLSQETIVDEDLLARNQSLRLTIRRTRCVKGAAPSLQPPDCAAEIPSPPVCLIGGMLASEHTGAAAVVRGMTPTPRFTVHSDRPA